MSNKNLLSGRNKELQEYAEQYETAKQENKTFYLDADDFADLADWYGAKKDFDKAIEIVEYGLRLHPSSTDLQIEHAYLFIDCGEEEKAREIIEKLPEDYLPEVKSLRAHLLLNEGKVDEAEKLLDTIEDKENIANVIDVAYMYLEAGYPDKAKEWLEPVEDEYGDKEAYLSIMADYYCFKGMFEEAIMVFNKLIDKDPYSAAYWLGLAKCYFEMGKFNQAIDACDYALISDDKLADAYVIRGHSFYQLGNEEAALESYQKAKQFKTIDSNFIYSFTGLCCIDQRKWEEGFENLEKAIQMSEKGHFSSSLLANLYANAALCLAQMGKNFKAHQYCQKAQKLNPKDAEAYLIEGRIYIEEEDYKSGMTQWTKAVKCAPCADTWNEIGVHSMDIGYWDYAKIVFERVLELDPNFPGINERLAVTYMILLDKENFIKYNQKCAHPLSVKELEKVQALLESNDDQNMAFQVQDIIKLLHK